MSDLVRLLQEFYRDKLTSLLRHQAGARVASQYDVNNAYQYIINREEVQLSWLRAAVEDLQATVDNGVLEPNRSQSPAQAEGARAILEEDIREAEAFVERWRPRVETMTNARHRVMLRVILGETIEQKRMFEQALAGRTDILGRHPEQAASSVGHVLPTRWIE